MKIYLTILMILFSANIPGQDIPTKYIKGSWVQVGSNWDMAEEDNNKDNDETIYKCYSGNRIFMFWFYKSKSKLLSYDRFFGFYDNCNLPSMDSLKQDGLYYFEVDSSDFEHEESREIWMQSACADYNIFLVGQDTMLNTYYSSRQQYVTYKKTNTLPKEVIEFLQKQGIEALIPKYE